MAIFIIEESKRCLQCRDPQCQKACPVMTPIPKIIRMFKDNELMEAGEILFENNPMSVVCSHVCNHEAQCSGHCILGKTGSPVRFFDIEKYISDTYLDRMRFTEAEKKGVSVAVIGSGPAGITVAVILARNGYDVTIFERRSMIGGMLTYGIPDFRLPRSLLTKYTRMLEGLGVKIRPNTTIGGALNIERLFKDGYGAVFVGTGVWRPKTLGIRGETLPNVHFGISYLSKPGVYDLGKEIAVIGAGNVAMDVSRVALRHGVERVTMYARGKRIAANAEEVEYARIDGADIEFGMQIVSIDKDGPNFKIARFDEEDNLIGYEDEIVHVHADSTIIAASQGPKDKLLLTTEGLEGSDKGLLVVNEKMMTTVPGVFAAGDVVHGSKTVVHAVKEAKIAAEGIMEYLENRKTEENTEE